MTIDTFWEIIEKARDAVDPNAALKKRLKRLSPEELASYQEHFDTLFEKAYRWDLWGAAYVIEGGCSDDGFMDFRYGLLSKGRAIYEKALSDPESLAELGIADEISNELFGYIASEVYEQKTGSEIPRKPSQQPDEPAGEEWEFDDEDEARDRFPKLMEMFWDAE